MSFKLENSVCVRTYVRYARGTENILNSSAILDHVPVLSCFRYEIRMKRYALIYFLLYCAACLLCKSPTCPHYKCAPTDWLHLLVTNLIHFSVVRCQIPCSSFVYLRTQWYGTLETKRVEVAWTTEYVLHMKEVEKAKPK